MRRLAMQIDIRNDFFCMYTIATYLLIKTEYYIY